MTAIAGGLITLEFAAEGLSFQGVGTSGQSARDADLTAYVQAATPVIEDLVGPVLQVTKTATFWGSRRSVTLPGHVTEITSITDSGTTLDPAKYTLDPETSIVWSQYALGFGAGVGPLVVTYVVGYSPVPATLQLAARELVRFWWQQGKSAFRPSFNEGPQAADTPQGFAVPKRVIELCRPFMTGATLGFA